MVERRALLCRTTNRSIGMEWLDALYQSLMPTGSADEFLWDVIRILGLDHDLSAQELANVPRSGSVVTVANQVNGDAQGLVVLAALRRLRPDVKLLIDHSIRHQPGLSALFIGVERVAGRAFSIDPYSRREVMRWLSDGGVVVASADAISELQPLCRGMAGSSWYPRVVTRRGHPPFTEPSPLCHVHSS